MVRARLTRLAARLIHLIPPVWGSALCSAFECVNMPGPEEGPLSILQAALDKCEKLEYPKKVILKHE